MFGASGLKFRAGLVECENMNIVWNNPNSLMSKSYVCGYCGNSLASNTGYFGKHPAGLAVIASIYLCHHCNGPTYFKQDGSQIPGPLTGYEVTNISDGSVRALYGEARCSFASNAFTGVILLCRKILMHIAVAKGASENLKFIEYVEYLSENHYIPPGSKDWVDHIRDKGNEANHEIVLGKREDAEELLNFVGVLLKMIFEFPAAMQRKK